MKFTSLFFVLNSVYTISCQIGGQRDEFGCLTPAGYSWCESLQECIRPFETTCPTTTTTTITTTTPPIIIGGERDEYGCLIPAGFSWCESLQQCIRPFETPCPTTTTITSMATTTKTPEKTKIPSDLVVNSSEKNVYFFGVYILTLMLFV
jgi:hypothetical protein